MCVVSMFFLVDDVILNVLEFSDKYLDEFGECTSIVYSQELESINSNSKPSCGTAHGERKW